MMTWTDGRGIANPLLVVSDGIVYSLFRAAATQRGTGSSGTEQRSHRRPGHGCGVRAGKTRRAAPAAMAVAGVLAVAGSRPPLCVPTCYAAAARAAAIRPRLDSRA